MKTPISYCARQEVGRLQKSQKQIGVFVDLDAINQLESRHADEGSQQSPQGETAIPRSAMRPMRLPSSVPPLPEPSKNETIEELRTEPLLALQEDPKNLARTTRDRVEHLLVLIDNNCNRVRRGVTEPSIGEATTRTGEFARSDEARIEGGKGVAHPAR